MGALLYAALLASGFWLVQDHIDPVEKADYLSDLLSNNNLWLLCFGFSAVVSAAIYGAKVNSASRYVPTAIYALIVGLRMALAVVDEFSHAILVFILVALLCFFASQMVWGAKRRSEKHPYEEENAPAVSFQEKVNQLRARQREARQKVPNNSLKSGTPENGAP
ncbi:DUF4401 domain-containing protein [Isoalcanivorax indicus]|uniref:DUF4401 domain-containing protein n=1 Tax=Isoalcanivorax indicus TaxID=2202653 RepID=UPI0013C49F05|nr:DUF4401 domain-containing protein [Isoalcanivorax indicus]